MTHDEIRELTFQAREGLKNVKAIVGVVANVVDSDEELVENISFLISKYGKLFIPTMNELTDELLNKRVEQFENLLSMGFSRNEAIRLITNR